MQFVFCILCFKQLYMFIHLSFQIYGHYGEGGKWLTPKIMYFISNLILLRFFTSDLPVVLMILREKKSKSEPKRTRKESEQMWQTWINSMGGFKEIFCDIYLNTIIQHN